MAVARNTGKGVMCHTWWCNLFAYDTQWQFTIEIKLCEDFIAQKLDAEDLNTISFSLIASEYFDWNGDEMSNIIFDWDNTVIGYDINLKNIQLWKDYLENGTYNLDKNELKEKFRSKGKYLKLYKVVRFLCL